MRIAAIADLHYRVNSRASLKQWMPGVEREADVLVLAGDLTDTGRTEEMEVLLKDLKEISLPKVAVLGNHDYESDQEVQLSKMLKEQRVLVLEGNVLEIDAIGFVGTKGFAGGLEPYDPAFRRKRPQRFH